MAHDGYRMWNSGVWKCRRIRALGIPRSDSDVTCALTCLTQFDATFSRTCQLSEEQP